MSTRLERWLYKLPLRLRSLFRGGRVEQELDEELGYHVQRLIDEHVARGLTPADARYAALRAMHGLDQRKEQCRDTRRVRAIDDLLKDLRYAARVLIRHPGFTTVAIVSLAIGIGANSAIFSVLNAVMLRSLPVTAPDELFVVRLDSRTPSTQRFSYPLFERLRTGLAPGTQIAAISRVARTYARIDGGEQEVANAQLVSGEFFSTLGVAPALGRTLNPEDNRTVGGHPVAVLSHTFWRRRFSAAPAVLGRDITVNGAHFTIVGVGAEGFSGVWLESPADLWVPVAMQGAIRYSQNYSASDAQTDKPWMPQERISWLDLIVRTQPSAQAASTSALNAAFQSALLRVAENAGNTDQRRLFLLQRLRLESFGHGFSTLRQRFAAPLFTLMAMVALLLLIACANTANLLLARAAARQREMAIRLSIGASRRRLIRQLLTESLLMGAIAGVAGLVMAQWASELLVRMTMGIATGPNPFPVGPDARVLLFTAAVSVATAVLFGLAPAYRSTRVELGTTLKATGRTVHGGPATAGKMLVVAQVALSLLLVVGAGLFLRSLRNLMHVDLGFDRDHIVSVAIDARGGAYPAARLAGLQREIIDRAEHLPGVQSATMAMCGLAGGCRANVDGIHISGYAPQPGEQVVIQENRVGPRYFSTVGMRLLAGRDFDAQDFARAPTVAIVNEAMVRRYFSGRPAIGQRFGYTAPTIEIVGIVQDARVNAAREPAAPMAFYPLGQGSPIARTLDVRTTGDPRWIAAALRKAVADADPNLPIERVTILADQVSAGLNQERLVARVTTAFGGLALGLACFGLYGLMSYTASRRTNEIGIRMALGASRGGVLAMVLKESCALAIAGIVAGVLGSLAATRLISTQLFDVSASDPFTIVTATLLMIAVAALAGFLPARRASRVEPTIALRCE